MSRTSTVVEASHKPQQLLYRRTKPKISNKRAGCIWSL